LSRPEPLPISQVSNQTGRFSFLERSQAAKKRKGKIMNIKRYTLGASGKLEPTTEEGKANLKIGQILQWHGYEYDKEVIYKKEISGWDDGIIYKTINIKSFSYGSHEAYGLTLKGEGVGIRVEITDKLISPEDLLTICDKAQAIEEAKDLKQKAHRKATDELIKKGKEIASQKIPANCKALIVAEYNEDESDSQTDYFNHATTKLVILATSKHNRDLFSEMRKGAAVFDQTKHLGPGKNEYIQRVVFKTATQTSPFFQVGQYSPWHSEMDKPNGNQFIFSTEEEAKAHIKAKGEPESVTDNGLKLSFGWDIERRHIEHREKYSMGQGYYLKGGNGGHSTGWQVNKMAHYSQLPDSVYISLAKMCLLK